MDKSYNPQNIETRWYQNWEENGYFAPSEAETSYCIMLPPPNVTGSLHMGHAFQDTIMDTLTRYHRMKGESALWQCGTDHAGIATQMVVERQLGAEGVTRHDLGREKFINKVWDWKKHSGGTITRQMRRLGASVDWENERFTMDEGLSDAVRKVFVTLHREGLIYRGKRLVNWDPVLHTALSDLEVISTEEAGHLWHLRYPRCDGKGYVVVATTRPETMLGDQAVAVHPDDERYQDLIGQQLELPLTGRKIPVIADDYVDMEFGTGCVKITPAHDFNDYEMGKRHQLPIMNILDDNACINNDAPEAYRGLDRFDARAQIIKDFDSAGLLEKIEDHTLQAPRGDRSGVIVEPYLTDQWYVDLTRESLEDGRPGGKTAITNPAIEAVKSGEIKFVPENWDKTYYNWLNGIQDWCISRQLWWGHRIPAWFDEDGAVYVGMDEAEVRKHYQLDNSIQLRQDEDVLDTWFSSALWPFSTLGWPEQTARLEQFYPGNVLVTGFDIIFFWVARMIMMGKKFMGDVPFKEVYIHGLILDSHGQKMSKSKGNVLDPIDLIDGIELEALVSKRTTGLMQPQMAPKIEKQTRKEFPDGIQAHGTDAMRFTFAAMATNGRDIRFQLERIEGYRNFCNKLWNAARFVFMNTDGHSLNQPEQLNSTDKWILSRLQDVTQQCHTHINSYRLDLYAQAIYEFVWSEYCDWYLEASKPAIHDENRAASTRHTLLTVLEKTLRLLHPVMPFITEEIWQKAKLGLNIDADTIMLQAYPEPDDSYINQPAENDFEWLRSVVTGIRKIRSEMNVAPGKKLTVSLFNSSQSDQHCLSIFQPELLSLARLESISITTDTELEGQSAVALVGEMKVLVPLAGLIDTDAEIARLDKEINKLSKEVAKSEAKLNNPRFVDNAPAAVVEKEKLRVEKENAQLHALKEQKLRLEKLA
ncbi:MAG: valine--tRNA ligase [bacterium]